MASPEAQTANMAKGYTEKEGQVAPAKAIHMSVPHAAGALIGTVEDLAKWNAAFNGGKVIRPELYAKMTARTRMPDGTTEEYGFGIYNRELRSRKAVGHSGGIFGFTTDSIYLPKEDVFVAVFANSDEPATSPGMLTMELAALAVEDPFPAFEKAALNAKAVEPWVGVYRVKDGDRRSSCAMESCSRSALAAGTGGLGRGQRAGISSEVALTWFELKRDAKGAPVMARCTSLPPPHPRRRRAADRSRRSPRRPTCRGRLCSPTLAYYEAPVGKLTVTLPAEGPMTVQLGGQQQSQWLAMSQTEFRTLGVDARLEFQIEGGKVTGVVLKQGGRDMPAKRVELADAEPGDEEAVEPALSRAARAGPEPSLR